MAMYKLTANSINEEKILRQKEYREQESEGMNKSTEKQTIKEYERFE